MNELPPTLFHDADPAPIEVDVDALRQATLEDEAHTGPRFPGDRSEMPAAGCYAYQELLGTEFLERASSKNWPAVLAHRDTIESRLAELNMRLVVDELHGVAYKTQVDSEADPQARRLLRGRAIKGTDLIVLGQLRLRAAQQAVVGDAAVIDRDELIDLALSFQNVADTNDSRFHQAVEASIQRMADYRIITPILDRDRFRISPVIAAAFPLSLIEKVIDAINDNGVTGALTTEVDDAGDPVEDEAQPVSSS